MSEFSVIADIGQTLVKLLQENLQELNLKPSSIALCSPADVNDKVSVSLFLYQIAENPHLKNQEVFCRRDDLLPSPPLYLDLYYLLTTYSNADLSSRSLEEHRILGKALQVFHDYAVLSGPLLQGGLTGRNDEFRISQNPLSLDDLYKLWSSFPNKQFRPSVSYLVTPVALDSSRSIKAGRVLVRDLDYRESGGD